MTRRMIGPLLFGIVGVAILVSLGVWQLHRLQWKTEILDRIAGRLASEPVAVPPSPDVARDQYLRVAADGVLEAGELHVYTSAPPRGVGYRVIAPFALADGRRILLDRGFVPIDEKDAVRPGGPMRVEGTLLWPQERDSFTADPDLAKNIWFARDVPAMAAALETTPVMLVVAASEPTGGPQPLPVTVNIPNDHLGYAIQWFGLALVWALMTGYLLWRIKRRVD